MRGWKDFNIFHKIQHPPAVLRGIADSRDTQRDGMTGERKMMISKRKLDDRCKENIL